MTALEEYIEAYGYHFSKKLYEWAVSMMRDRNGNKIKPKTKEEVDSFLKANGVTLNNNFGHDAAYVHAKFVADFLDDRDGVDSKALDHFVADCNAREERIYWDLMI